MSFAKLAPVVIVALCCALAYGYPAVAHAELSIANPENARREATLADNSEQSRVIQAPDGNAADDEKLMTQINALFQQGELGKARELLSQQRLKAPLNLGALFVSGMMYMQQGKYDAAADEFKAMLARDASLPWPRLELALALYWSQNYAEAQRYFELALASDLPENVRATVRQYQAAVRQYLPSYFFSVDAMSDSNPAQASSSNSVLIGGFPYQLNAAPDKPVSGMMMSLSGFFPQPKIPAWFIRTSANLTDFPNKDSDQFYLQGTAGKYIYFATHTLVLEFGGHDFEYQQRNLYTGVVLRASDFLRQNERSVWQFMAEGREQTYPLFNYLNGWQYVISAEHQYVLPGNSRLKTGLTFFGVNARDAHNTYTNPSVYLSYAREWTGMAGSLRYQYGEYAYRGADPVFAGVRHDTEQKLELDLISRKLNLHGFYPHLTVGVIRHPSDIAFYEFSRRYLRVGVSKEF